MISVIIPVYNSAATFRDCIASVKAQTLGDWECILVDDGSTDGSGALCDAAAAEDVRIIAVHKAHGGVSSARNEGLAKAQGEYVAFLDSDDVLEPVCLAALYEATVSFGCDLVVGGISEERGGKKMVCVPSETHLFPLDSVHIGNLVELEEKNLLFGPWLKLYRKSILDEFGMCFPLGKQYAEDMDFNLAYLEKVRTVATVSSPVYRYRRMENSLSMRLRPDMFEQDYKQWRALKDFHERTGLYDDTAERYLYVRLWGTVYDGIFLYPQLDGAGIGYLKKILSIPEIGELEKYQDSFNCSPWIKKAILQRRALSFYLYFLFKR